MLENLIFELSSPGRKAYSLPGCDVPQKDIEELIPERFLRNASPELPEVSELDIVRHFTRLSQLNYSIDTHFYPLGSCTMKYNPKINDTLASLEGFTQLHPYQPESHCQGILRLLYEFEQVLKEICGMDAFSLQPSAGAHGELTGMLITHAYHKKKGEKRGIVIIPDSAHGTNPASAAMCGYEVVEIKSNTEGLIDLEELKHAMTDMVAALMITNPNTLGLFEKDILKISQIVHDAGGLLYCDGANMDALLGIARPGDMGVDILHLNLHKTFSTPHGGGGPGAGPIGVKENLKKFLPIPTIEKRTGRYTLNYNKPDSIGRIRAFYGNIGVIIRAYTYLLALGKEGLRRVGENAVLNANYLRNKLSPHYDIPYGKHCMHEFVLSFKKQKGISTLDIAKRLLDYGFHAPTIYFPLIVEEALMIEPTETESKETLDAFANALISIANEIETQPELLKGAPHTTPVARLDEVKAAREPNLRWQAGLGFGI
ncbi:MAG: aminomethyl-transferring glycine dehydrogenase subunit GcvPB [Candidatus Brocadiales bacterium]|nr:aminomethyl-transferring glycine dehydrogenase subunit GcvPB [Candidatus Brocadiales bacterium]